MLNKELNDGYIIGFPLRKGQSAKVTETFSENLTKTDISALKLMSKRAAEFSARLLPDLIFVLLTTAYDCRQSGIFKASVYTSTQTNSFGYKTSLG